VRTYVRLMFYFDRRIRFIARRQNDDIGGCHQWENGGHAAECPGLKCPSATNRAQASGDLRTHGRVKRGVVHLQIWSVLHNACLPPRRNLNSAAGSNETNIGPLWIWWGRPLTSVPSPCPTGSRICVRPEPSEWSILFKLTKELRTDVRFVDAGVRMVSSATW